MAKTLLDNIIESIKGIDGRLVNQSGTTKQMIADLNYKVVAPAKSAADSAASAADAAVASAQVTSATVSAVASATAEAKAGANEAMSRAKSAWDVATGAKEAVTDFDPLLKSAQSNASEALTQIADTASALSDAKTAFGSDVAVAKALANTAQTTADSAIKSAASVASDLTAVASQAKSNADGITKVTSDVGLLQTTVADNSGNISKIQETATKIQQAVSDNSGNITTAKQTADSAVTVASDARSNATVAIQTASQASITASSASGQAASAVITANGAVTTASNAKSDATVAVQTASGASLTATNAQSDATIAKQTASEATVQASNAESDFAQISIRANKIEANVATNSGAIASVQQTANGLTTTVGKVDNRVKTIEDKTNWTTMTGPLDMNTLTTTQNIFYTDTNLQNADGETGWAYIQVVNVGEQVTQTVWHDRSCIQHTRMGAVSGSSYIWYTWNENATDAQVTQVKQTIDGITTTINDPKTGLNATYQTAAGNSSTISSVKGDVTQLQTTANGLTIKVGDLESKTNKQQTAIEQNKTDITLKADQTTVNTLKGTVDQNTATLKAQSGQIQAKVSSSDVTGMLTGYATQSYTQSLVTQTAKNWNLNLTNLQTDVNAIKTTGGGVNLLQGTRDFSDTFISGDKVTVTNGGDNFKAAFGTQNSSQPIFDLVTFSSIPLEKDTDYTASFWVKTSEDTDIVSFLYDSGSNGAYADGTTVNHSTTDYTRIVVHFHNGNNTATPTFIPARINKAGVTVWIYGCMLEEGTVAHTWSPAPSDMATVTSVTNLSAAVDGIKSTVATKADQSTVTQLSNAIQSKVESSTYTSAINQLSNDINLRVKSADLISQINLQAGTSLIQSNKLVLDAGTTIFTGNAFIPSAAIANLTADDITTGTLKGVDVDFRDSNSTGMYASGAKLAFDVANSPVGYISYTSVPLADWPQGSGGNELKIMYEQSLAIAADSDTDSRALFSTVDTQIGYYQQGNTPSNWGLTGLKIDNADRQINLGVYGSDGKWSRLLASSGSVELNASDNNGDAHCHLDSSRLHFYKDNDNSSPLAVELQVDGWTWVRGYVEAMGHTQHSTLSTKTRIEEADPDHMLDLVNNTELTTFAFKSEVAEGVEVRHIGPIIDDINDVAQYKIPSEFIAPTKAARDDDNMIGALFGAVQALTKRIKKLEEKA